MQKRGQVTLFVVIALVILITIGLYLYAREEYGVTVPPPTYLSAKLHPITEDIHRCIDQEFQPGATLLGLQGGSFTPAKALRYKNTNVKIVCANIPGKDQCLNLLQPITRIESELQNYLHFKLNGCITRDLTEGKGHTTEGTKAITVNARARDNSVTVTVNYDVRLVKDAQTVRVPTITKIMPDAPLQELYAVVLDIVNSEALYGNFDNLGYMLQKRGQYIIELDKPFPHKIYTITKKNSNYHYRIAIEGEA